MTVFRGLLTAAVVVALSGCGMFGSDGMFRDRKNDYLLSGETPNLALPAETQAPAIQDYYFVPPIDVNAQAEPDYEVPRPMRLAAGDTDNLVKIQSLGKERWILIRQVPGQVWPRIRDFLLANRIGVQVEDIASGTMETGWLVTQNDASSHERYRFTVRQGLQRNSSEVYVLNHTIPAPEEGEVDAEKMANMDWPMVSSDPERRKVFTDALAQYLAENADLTAAVSLKAQAIDTARRMYLAEEPEPHIAVKVERERAWASLAYALQKSGFQIDDQNNAEGVFFTTYTGRPDEQEEEGFWSSLFGGDEEFTGTRYTVRLLPGSEPGWLEIHLDKEEAFQDNEQQEVLNEIKGFLT